VGINSVCDSFPSADPLVDAWHGDFLVQAKVSGMRRRIEEAATSTKRLDLR